MGLYFPLGWITNVIGKQIEVMKDRTMVIAARSGDLYFIANLFLEPINLITKNKCMIKSTNEYKIPFQLKLKYT